MSWFNDVAAVIARRLAAAPASPERLEDARELVRQAMWNEPDRVRERFDLLSSGEMAVACALLFRCGFTDEAESWSQGRFLSLVRKTGGEHLEAVVTLLRGAA